MYTNDGYQPLNVNSPYKASPSGMISRSIWKPFWTTASASELVSKTPRGRPPAGLHVMMRKTRSPSRSIPPDASMNTISPEVFRPWARSISGVIAATMVSSPSWETAVRAPACFFSSSPTSSLAAVPYWMRFVE